MKSAKCDDCEYTAKGEDENQVVQDLKGHAKDTHDKDVTDDEAKQKVMDEGAMDSDGGMLGGDDKGM